MLMIIIGHTYNGYPIGQEGYYFPEFLKYTLIAYWGGMGAGVFLFLSGYGMFLSLQNHTVNKNYVFSKFRRLFEPFIVYWIIEIFILALSGKNPFSADVITNILTLSIYPNIENWFFKVIIVLYIGIILLFLTPLSHWKKIITVFSLSIVYLAVMYYSGFGSWWYNNIILFPIGMLVAYKYDFFARLNAAAVTITTALLFIVAVIIHFNLILTHLFFAVFITYCIRYININNGILYYIGINSFVFYYLECPAMDHLAMFAYNNFPVYSILTLIITFALSSMSVYILKRIK